MPANSRVMEVIRLIHGMVEPGGGAVAFVSFDNATGDLAVSYRAGATEFCSVEDQGGSCAITADMIAAFLRESFQSRGLKVGQITVRPAA